MKHGHLWMASALLLGIVSVPAASAKQRVDAKSDLGIKVVGSTPLSQPRNSRFESKHFTLRVQQEKKEDENGACVRFCTDEEQRSGTLALLTRIEGVMRPGVEKLILQMPVGQQTAYDGATEVQLSSTLGPPLLQHCLANAEAAYEVFASYYGFPPLPAAKKMHIEMSNWGSSGKYRNQLYVEALSCDKQAFLHELFHVFQQGFKKNMSGPMSESGAEFMQAVMSEGRESVWHQFHREDDSLIYRGSRWRMNITYRVAWFYDYLGQRLWQLAKGRAATRSDLDTWKRIGVEFFRDFNLDSPNVPRGTGSDETVVHGDHDLALFRRAVRRIRPTMSDAQAEAFIGEVTEDYWESWILDGQEAWQGRSTRGGRAKMFIHAPSRTRRDCENTHFGPGDWIGRHYLAPLCWKEFATWNQHYHYIYSDRYWLVRGKRKPGRAVLLPLDGQVTFDRVGAVVGATDFEPQKPGINPYNARYAVIDTSGQYGILKLKAAAHPAFTTAPRVRLYQLLDAPGHPLGKKWSLYRELKPGATYALELGVQRDVNGTLFGTASGGSPMIEQLIALVTTRNHYSEMTLSTSFQKTAGPVLNKMAWSPPGSGRQVVSVHTDPAPRVDLGVLRFQRRDQPRNKLLSLGFETRDSSTQFAWSFLLEVNKLRLYEDANRNRRYDAGETIYFDAAPAIGAGYLDLDLETRGVPIDLYVPWNSHHPVAVEVRLEAVLKKTLTPFDTADVSLRVAGGRNRLSGTSGGQAFFTSNQPSRLRLIGRCVDEPTYHTLPYLEHGFADGRGTVRYLVDLSSANRKDCQKPRFSRWSQKTLEPGSTYETLAGKKLRESLEVVAFRLRNEMPVEGFVPTLGGEPVTPQVRMVDDEIIEYSYFDETAVDCGYENRTADDALPLEPGGMLAGQGVCPGQPRVYRLEGLPGKGALRVHLNDPGALVEVTTPSGLVLARSDAESETTVNVPSGLESVLMVLHSADPVARVETDVFYEFGPGGAETEFLEPPEPDLDEPLAGLADAPNASLEDAAWIEPGDREGWLRSEAWFFFSPESDAVHRVRCGGSQPLRVTVYDGDRLEMETGHCDGGTWLGFHGEPGRGHFLRLAREDSSPDDEAPADFSLTLEDTASPLPCDGEPHDNDAPEHALSLAEGASGTLCDGASRWFYLGVPEGEIANVSLDGGTALVAACRDADGVPLLTLEREEGFSGSLRAGEYLCELHALERGVDFRLEVSLGPEMVCEGLCTCGNGICEELVGEHIKSCPADCEGVEG